MSMTGLEVFDKTLQTTNIWLEEIGEVIGPDRQRCYHALMAVLHALRDRLPVEESAHLAAQMPLLVKGIYFHGWKPGLAPGRGRKLDDFLDAVAERLDHIRPLGPDEACRAVFSVLDRHIAPGECDKVRQALPKDIRRLWPGDGSFMPPPERQRDQPRAGDF
jgi:uncharacterized protein (DUF2267 family)